MSHKSSLDSGNCHRNPATKILAKQARNQPELKLGDVQPLLPDSDGPDSSQFGRNLAICARFQPPWPEYGKSRFQQNWQEFGHCRQIPVSIAGIRQPKFRQIRQAVIQQFSVDQISLNWSDSGCTGQIPTNLPESGCIVSDFGHLYRNPTNPYFGETGRILAIAARF